jgi:hypothetical protein
MNAAIIQAGVNAFSILSLFYGVLINVGRFQKLR